MVPASDFAVHFACGRILDHLTGLTEQVQVVVVVKTKAHISVLHVADHTKHVPPRIRFLQQRRHKKGGVQTRDLQDAGEHHCTELNGYANATNAIRQRGRT